MVYAKHKISLSSNLKQSCIKNSIYALKRIIAQQESLLRTSNAQLWEVWAEVERQPALSGEAERVNMAGASDFSKVIVENEHLRNKLGPSSARTNHWFRKLHQLGQRTLDQVLRALTS